MAAVGAMAAWSPPLARVGQSPSHRPVRVLIAPVTLRAVLATAGAWRLIEAGGRAIAAAEQDREWIVERSERGFRLTWPGGGSTGWTTTGMRLEAADADATWGLAGRQYRGAAELHWADTALLVVNRIDVEDYLRGVVPLEIGTRAPQDHAAVEAQAVAARSFTYSRMLGAGARDWDLTATETDQVYGGVGAETFIGDLAVAATAGWVLTVNGRVVIAPYHAACGGATTTPSAAWRGGADDYLRSVSDLVPGSDRAWCEISPRFAWERRIALDTLIRDVVQYAPAYVGPAASRVGDVTDLAVAMEGDQRVTRLVLMTDQGTLELRGTEIRLVLRPDGSDLLPSTRFSVDRVSHGPSGRASAWLFRGRGNGHGVGMCQWGAIGRARAGHDFRAILKAYYPGASLSRAP